MTFSQLSDFCADVICGSSLGHYEALRHHIVALNVFSDSFDGERLRGADEAHDRDGLRADCRSHGGDVAHFAREGQNVAHGDDEVLEMTSEAKDVCMIRVLILTLMSVAIGTSSLNSPKKLSLLTAHSAALASTDNTVKTAAFMVDNRRLIELQNWSAPYIHICIPKYIFISKQMRASLWH